MRLERANSKRPVTWVSFAGIVLVPIIVAAGFILATWKSSDRLETIDAAIVNNDDGAEVDGQTVPIGREMTSGLVGETENNIHWVITDADDAEKGLSDGRYAARLTIPEGFSRAVTSVSDAQSATQTQLDVDVSGTAPATDQLISRSVAEVARTKFNTTMTENYLDNIYLGFNDMGTQMRKLSDAAGELDEGAQELSRGAGQSAEGAGELADGMGELDTAGGELNTGAGDLATGAGELAKGTSGLASGLDEMKTQTKDLPKSTQDLADGAGKVSDGVDEYTTSIDEILKGLSGSGEGGTGDLIDGAKDLDTGAADVARGASGLSDGLVTYRDELKMGADDADRLARSGTIDGLDDVVDADQARQIRAQLCPVGTPDEVCAGLEKAYAQGLLNGTTGGLNSAAEGLGTTDDSQSLLGGANDLSAGADELSDGMSRFAKGLEEGLGRLGEIAKNAPQLLEASESLRDGASEVADGNQQLADGMPKLADGIAEAADGSSQLDEGAGELADGADRFAGGLGKYTAGVSQAATGTQDLASGLDQLAEGSEKYTDGVGEFSAGVQEGADEVPSYSAPDRDKLSRVASANIAAPEMDSVTNLLTGSTVALLIMLALWVGGLVTYTVLRPIPASTLLSTQSSVAVWLRGLVPGLAVGLVQALVLAILAVTVMDIDAIQGFDIAVLTFVSALVFMVLNFALVAWFGGVGRFLSVIAVVLAVAGRTIGAVPEFFTFLAPLLPLTPAMNGFSAIAAGTSGLAAAYGGLLAWAVIGLIMSLLAIVRARTTKPEAALAMA